MELSRKSIRSFSNDFGTTRAAEAVYDRHIVLKIKFQSHSTHKVPGAYRESTHGLTWNSYVWAISRYCFDQWPTEASILYSYFFFLKLCHHETLGLSLLWCPAGTTHVVHLKRILSTIIYYLHHPLLHTSDRQQFNVQRQRNRAV